MNYNKRFTSKDELYDYLKENDLYGLDSQFSKTTEKLKEKFSATDVHFNRWWILTPTTWRCPACNREKQDIVKINKHGHLSGILHEHHDHMKDLVKEKFEEYAVSCDEAIADKLAEKFAIKLSFALSAYDNTIICSDCNAADAKAKKLVATHKSFSFSPSDISKFIIVTANKEHQIDKEQALEIWLNQQDIFNIRMEFLNSVAKIAATNQYWYKPSDITAKEIVRISQHYMNQYGFFELSHNPEYLLYKSDVYKASSTDKWRTSKALKHGKIPSKQEIQHIINIRNQYWKKVDDDWFCPICQRSKIECVVPSKKNPWVFVIYKKPFYGEDNSYENKQYICNECHKVHTHIHKEVDQEQKLHLSDEALITKDELRELIISCSNDIHELNNEYAEQLLEEMKNRYNLIQMEKIPSLFV